MPHRNANDAIQYKRKKPLNVWILVSVLVFIYLIVYLCFFFFNTRVSFNEVTEGVTAGKFETQYTGLAIRSETMVPAEDSGYVNFFVGDGTQIYSGEDVYMLDKKGKLSEKLKDNAASYAMLNGNDLQKLKDTIYDFDTSFDPQHYYDTYSFKYRLESQVLDLINNSVFEDTVNNAGADPSDYTIVSSDKSGIIMHNVDGFEDMDYTDIESSFFKKADYKKTLIKSNDKVKSGDPVYKVITDDTWYIVFQIMDTRDFEGIDEVTIEFLKDNITANCEFTTFTKSGNTYGVVTLTKYMIRYISDRFLQIRIHEDYHEGLKVLKSSVFERQFFAIPSEYIVQGGNSGDSGFLLRRGKSADFVTPVIMMSDGETSYVALDNGFITDGDELVKPDSTETFTVGRKENHSGVFAIESGYAHFKIVDILGENNNYYIIKNNTRGGIRLYEQVVDDHSAVYEGQEVY